MAEPNNSVLLGSLLHVMCNISRAVVVVVRLLVSCLRSSTVYVLG